MRGTFLFKGILVVIVIALVLSACHSSYGYMDSFESFVERVEKNASSYSNEEWEKKDEQLHEYLDDYYEVKKELSPEEKRKVGELTMRYYKSRVMSLGLDVLGEVSDWLNLIQGFADEIKKDIND